jgi:hypothetical protein
VAGALCACSDAAAPWWVAILAAGGAATVEALAIPGHQGDTNVADAALGMVLALAVSVVIGTLFAAGAAFVGRALGLRIRAGAPPTAG